MRYFLIVFQRKIFKIGLRNYYIDREYVPIPNAYFSDELKFPFSSRNLSGLNFSGSGNNSGS